MIRYLIKNNFKLMGRNFANTFMLTLCPVIVSAVLISAFSSLMATYEKTDTFTAGYRVEKGSIWEMTESALKEAGAEAGIRMVAYPDADPETCIRENDLGGFVTFGSSEYTIYRTEDQQVEGMMLESFVSMFCDQVSDMAQHPEKLAGMGTAKNETALSVEHPSFIPAVDSRDYYGIVYILYFPWCALVCAAGIFTSEKKYGINKKYFVSELSDTQLYLAKFIPTSILVFLEICIAALLVSACFGVNWGNPLLVGLILAVMIPAAVALGLMIYSITDNVIMTMVILFATVWIAGFFGGTFETYMFSPHSRILKLLSPLYHCNRAVIEQASMGHSDYYLSALLYCGGIVIVCSLLAIGVAKLRRRGRA